MEHFFAMFLGCLTYDFLKRAVLSIKANIREMKLKRKADNQNINVLLEEVNQGFMLYVNNELIGSYKTRREAFDKIREIIKGSNIGGSI